MQKKIQVNQIIQEFSDYGLLLYIFTAVIFSNMILRLITDMAALNYISISLNSYIIISAISEWVISIIAIIIVFFLMLIAYKINSISRTPITNRISTFSILWFVFYLIGQIFYWIKGFEPINNLNLNIYNGNDFFNWLMIAILLLANIFQIIVWISFRSFFVDNNYAFPVEHCKQIRNSLILVIIASNLMLCSSSFTVILNQAGSFTLNDSCIYPWYMAFFVTSDFVIDILFIFGYLILGYRFRGLKNAKDVSMPKNYYTEMQERTQGDKLKSILSRYGILLYLFTLIIFIQVIFGIINNLLFFKYISISLNIYLVLFIIIDWIFPIFGIIIVILLMMEAIKVNNITYTTFASRFSTFSILWFIFFVIAQGLFYIILIIPLQNYIINVLNLNLFFTLFQFTIGLLVYIFQLNTWIALRGFIIKKGDIFPSNRNKTIQNSVLILIIATSVMLYSSIYYAVSIHITPAIYSNTILWWTVYIVIFSIFEYILFIIGYSLLGHRLRNLERQKI